MWRYPHFEKTLIHTISNMSTKQMWHHEPSVRCPVAQCGHGHCEQCGQAGHTSHPWSGLTQHPHFWKGSTIRGKNRECFQSGHQEFWIPTGSIQNECSFLPPVPELILDQNTLSHLSHFLSPWIWQASGRCLQR